MDVKAG